MESNLFGLTPRDIRYIAFQLAERLNLQHKFDRDTKMAGEDWFRGFMIRHPKLSLRKPEATSAARARAFNKHALAAFFKIAGEVMEKYKFPASRIFNVDETGITVVPKSMGSIVSVKGKKQVGYMTSAERGELVTAEICFSAVGQYMPPMLIFPRKNANPEFEIGKPEGAWAEYHPSGWMQSDIFTRWMKKFIAFTKATKDDPVLLYLDGHSTHTKNLEVLDLAADNGVIMVSFPPHTSHRMQPLDLSFMKPLSNYMTGEINKALRLEKGKAISIKKIFPLFARAFAKAATMETAQNGFKKAGLVPFNPDIYGDKDFQASQEFEDSEDEMATEKQIIDPISAGTNRPSEGINANLKSLNQNLEGTPMTENHEPAEQNSITSPPLPENLAEQNSTISPPLPEIVLQNRSEFSEVLRNIKREFATPPKKTSKNVQPALLAEIDLTVSEGIPLDGVPISSVAENEMGTVIIDSDMIDEENQTPFPISSKGPDVSGTKKRPSTEQLSAGVPLKKSRRGKPTVLTSPEYRKELQEEKEAAIAKKETAAAKKQITAAKKQAAARKKEKKKLTKAELEQALEQQQALNAQMARSLGFLPPYVNEIAIQPPAASSHAISYPTMLFNSSFEGGILRSRENVSPRQ